MKPIKQVHDHMRMRATAAGAVRDALQPCGWTTKSYALWQPNVELDHRIYGSIGQEAVMLTIKQELGS